MATKTKVEYILNKSKLVPFIRNVRQELLNIQSGEPKWRSGPPLHFEEGKSVPIFATLDRFEANPTKKTLDAFIAQAAQDLGKATGKGFETWSAPVFHTVTTEGEVVVTEKTFAYSIKDGWYDCFKVAHISMDQKQVDLMSKAATRMAESFQAEIKRGISGQLDELVKRMKKAEKNDD